MTHTASTPPLPFRVAPSALVTLLALSIERLARGRRLLVLGALFLLPSLVAALAQYYNPDYQATEAEQGLIFYLIPQALLPLTALVLASGIVQDEVEEQTLTYLLIRPLPRWSIYLAKLVAVVLIAAFLAFLFTLVTLLVVHWGGDPAAAQATPGRFLRIAGLMALACLPYAAIFGLFNLFLKRGLVAGVAYILLFEGVFANIDFVVRKATVAYYIRVLAERWLGVSIPTWSIDMDLAPGASGCLVRLLGATALAVALGAIVFSLREFRLKTPEGT